MRALQREWQQPAGINVSQKNLLVFCSFCPPHSILYAPFTLNFCWAHLVIPLEMLRSQGFFGLIYFLLFLTLLFLLCSFFPVSCSVVEKPKKARENKPNAFQLLPKVCFKFNKEYFRCSTLFNACYRWCQKSYAAAEKE